MTMSAAIIQVLRLYWNYAGGTFCYSYVLGSLFYNCAGDCFSYNYAVQGFCSTHADDTVWIEYVGDNFYSN